MKRHKWNKWKRSKRSEKTMIPWHKRIKECNIENQERISATEKPKWNNCSEKILSLDAIMQQLCPCRFKLSGFLNEDEIRMALKRHKRDASFSTEDLIKLSFQSNFFLTCSQIGSKYFSQKSVFFEIGAFSNVLNRAATTATTSTTCSSLK